MLTTTGRHVGVTHSTFAQQQQRVVALGFVSQSVRGLVRPGVAIQETDPCRHGPRTGSASREPASPSRQSANAVGGRHNLAKTSKMSPASSAGESEQETLIGSIRFVPHVEFSSRLSLNFEPMERKVSSKVPMKVGRFNEKSNNKTAVTFKSKVVSRLHAELWCEDGTWFIKDAKSSSGTFVNHIRLSPPGQESKPVILTDGDSIQFGIDFRGGMEEVYRCVRTKVELNRIFQRSNEMFNKSAHKKLKVLTNPDAAHTSTMQDVPNSSDKMDDGASTYTAECCICLFAIAPSQALFVAPCSHAYHYKCIRPLIMQHYPNFLCCVCRKYADLEASVEVESEAWITSQARDDPRTPTIEQDEPLYQPIGSVLASTISTNPTQADNPGSSGLRNRPDRSDTLENRPLEAPLSSRVFATSPVNVVNRLVQDLTLERQDTPRNNAGPFLIDGGSRH